MALIENNVLMTTKYGKMPAFVACPDEAGSFPAIILYMDAPGFREELCNMARRIAKNGYFCVLPDMYYRLGMIRFDIPRRTDEMSVLIKGAMNSLTTELVAEDTAGILAFIDSQDKAKTGPVGCVGHCMSGQHITVAAALFPTRIAAAASLYGVGIVTEDENSPHKMVDKIQGELFYSFAETDGAVEDHEITDLKSALDAAGTNYIMERPADTLHGYMFAERPAYNPVESEAAWGKLFALWERNLK